MPVKVWAPYERLTAGDLNAAFATVSAGEMPGVIATVGTSKAITAGTATEVSPGDPIAGADSGGFWNYGTHRAGVPTGQGGLYLAVAHIGVDGNATDNSKGRLHITGIGGPNATQGFVRMIPALGNVFATLTIVATLAPGALVYPMVTLYTVGGNAQCYGFALIRLAWMGAYYLAALDALGERLEERAEDATLPDATLPQGEGAPLAAEGEEPPKVTPRPVSDATLLGIAGIIAAVLGGIDAYRTRGESLTAWAAIVLGVALAFANLNP